MGILQKLKIAVSHESIVKIKNDLLFILDKIGLNEIFRLINKNKLIILFYHGVTDHNRISNPFHIPQLMFKQQIIYLKKKNYKFITLTEWVNIIKKQKKISNRYVIITFDDGLKNSIENAYPILQKYGGKGCYYIISDFIGNFPFLWWDFIDIFLRNYNNSEFNFIYIKQQIKYPLNSENDIRNTLSDIILKIKALNNIERLSHLEQFYKLKEIHNFQEASRDYLIADWKDIKSLNNNLLEIGSHTKTHPDLRALNTEEELYQELSESKVKIEKETGNSIKHLCYPQGFYNNFITKQAKKYGYVTGVSGIRGFNTPNSDLFQLKRLMGYNNFTLFKANISGLFSFLQKFLRLLHKKKK